MNKKMNRQQFMQAYKQAPWRKQVQLIGLFSTVVVILMTGAGIYLYVTASAATLGREIQDMQAEKQELQQRIENYQSEIAALTSARTMEERALELGFEQVNPATAAYVVVPGYGGKQTVELAPPPEQGRIGPQTVRPEYTMTLFNWLAGIIDQLTGQTGAGQ
jgi:cell division protein FtsL